MAIDEAQFYDEVAGRCAALLDTFGYTQAAYLVDNDWATDTPSACCVKVYPGGGELVYPDSGAPLYKVRFSTILWWRNSLDRVDRADQRLIGTAGAIRAATGLRFGVSGPPAIPGLVGTFLLDETEPVTVPVLMTSAGRPTRVQGLETWLTIRDEWSAAFPFEWTTTGG